MTCGRAGLGKVPETWASRSSRSRPYPILERIANGGGSPEHRITLHQAGGPVTLSLEELDHRAKRVGWHLRQLGIRPGDRVGIIARNRLEWLLLDLACLKIKAVSAGFEPSKFAAPAHLADRYGLRLVFTDRSDSDPRVLPIGGVLTALDAAPADPDLPPVTFSPEDVVTIKFTSGSTGEPKGLGATAASIDSSLSAVQSQFRHGPGDKLFVFLPLSLLQQRYWVYSALTFHHDVAIATYELAFHSLRKEEPTVVMGVPGFFEALRKEIERPRAGSQAGAIPASSGADLARRARAVLGRQIRYLWSGSAPANPNLLAFFERCGMPILEGYGLTETCIVAKNTPAAHRLGSVGRPLQGKRIHLDPGGIIIVTSQHPVNRGYLDDETGASESVFLPDGSVRTGDLGHIDADGFLYILGRADDLVVLGNGRNVLVRPLEERLCVSPQIENCIIAGFGQDHLVAIICATPDALRAEIEAHIRRVNAETSADERIGDFVLADEPFSLDNGLLTSQYKPRRRQILTHYQDAVAHAHGGAR